MKRSQKSEWAKRPATANRSQNTPCLFAQRLQDLSGALDHDSDALYVRAACRRQTLKA
jgi:hypothetical protein